MRKKLLSIVLVSAMLLGCLSGCGRSQESDGNEANSNDSVAEMAEDADGDSAAEDGSLRLSDEILEFEIWHPMMSSAAPYVDTIEDNITWSKVEEMFGVELTFIEEPEANMKEKFQLLIASDDLPDVIYYTNFYPAGGEALIDEGIALDLSQYTEYLPNYMALLESDERLARDAVTDSGKMYELFTIQNYVQPAFTDICIRGDWLEQVGMENPTTVDELHDVLVAFKEQCTGGLAPMQLYQDGFGQFNTLIGMFHVAADPSAYNWWTVVDGEVKFSPYLDGFKQYITTMNQWYEEGLIDPNYTSNTEPLGSFELLPQTGALVTLFTQAGSYYADAGYIEEDGYFLIGNMPTVDGKERTVGQYRPSALLKQGVLINPECENIPELLTMLDYFYSEEGGILATYGVEGETYDYDADGNIVPKDIIINNENMSISAARHAYNIRNFSMYNYREIEDTHIDEYAAEYLTKWVNTGFTSVLPLDYLTMTEDEGNEYNSLISNINTYILEWSNQFITGAKSLDQWDEFIAGFDALDEEGAQEIISAAYDRYMNRSAGSN